MSIKRSVFESIIIESNDQLRKADITPGCVQIDYYEDIFSPVITAKIRVINTGGTIVGLDSKDNQPQGLYNGLPLNGGERIRLKISGNRKGNPGLDFYSDPKDYLYVCNITDVISDDNKESFTLHLISREAITNETSRVSGKYTTSISESVRDILTNILKANKIGSIDDTLHSYKFIGNLKKPFTILTWLASKSVPYTTSSEANSNAGFLFYQTKDGFQFKSLDFLLDRKKNIKKATFTYSGALETYDTNDDKLQSGDPEGNDFKILNYITEKNQNLIEQLKLGTYACNTLFFDPYKFTFTTIDGGTFIQKKYEKQNQPIGTKGLKLPKISDDSQLTLGDIPTRIITGIYDVGTMDKGASYEINSNQMQYQAQSLLRYNSLFAQFLKVMIPSNTNLRAGDLIECRFPRIARGKSREYDLESSVLYIIKELCHHFDATRSYTSLKLVRPDFGI